jgi:hypothetical protein
VRLRSHRGWDGIARRLGLDGDPDPARLLEACRVRSGAPDVEWVVAEAASRARPAARGRYLEGTITLFPRAFADPRTLAHTALHELAHARGLGEEAAEALVHDILYAAEAL